MGKVGQCFRPIDLVYEIRGSDFEHLLAFQARAGAQVSAMDLTEKSLEISGQCVEVFGLQDQIRFVQANAQEGAGAAKGELQPVHSKKRPGMWLLLRAKK